MLRRDLRFLNHGLLLDFYRNRRASVLGVLFGLFLDPGVISLLGIIRIKLKGNAYSRIKYGVSGWVF